MYGTLLLRVTVLPQQLGFTSESNGGSFKSIVPTFSNNLHGHHQHLPKSNFKNSAVKSNNPLSWDDDYYLFQNPTKPTIFKDDDDSTSLGILGEEEDVGKLKKDDVDVDVERSSSTRRRRTMRRSNMIAKQVISVQSALSLGFVSQLWVDVTSWLLLVVEVKPNLLSGEQERFLLEDIMQVGDVVLVEDESVTENEFKLVGLDTLVGYNVVTPARRKIGKVRGYSFNVDSGAVELLELDSFGMSIIPSSLVSTYALFVEDVLEVGSDTVVVHEAAASRIQRLTKGLWDTQSAGDEYPEPRKQQAKSKSRLGRNRKYQPEMAETADDWELPMDFL